VNALLFADMGKGYDSRPGLAGSIGPSASFRATRILAEFLESK
jgi:hypothetical protein